MTESEEEELLFFETFSHDNSEVGYAYILGSAKDD